MGGTGALDLFQEDPDSPPPKPTVTNERPMTEMKMTMCGGTGSFGESSSTRVPVPPKTKWRRRQGEGRRRRGGWVPCGDHLVHRRDRPPHTTRPRQGPRTDDDPKMANDGERNNFTDQASF